MSKKKKGALWIAILSIVFISVFILGATAL